MTSLDLSIWVRRSLANPTPLMTGKLFDAPLPLELEDEFEWLFYHAHSQSEHGFHEARDSHGGLDTSLVHFLMNTVGDQPGLLAWHRHGDPARQHDCIRWADFLALATYRVVNGRYRLFVLDAARERRYFTVPNRWLPRYDLGILPHDPRGTAVVFNPHRVAKPAPAPPKAQLELL